MRLPNHGANPKTLATQMGTSLTGEAIDFSVNTNPFGPPPQLLAYLRKQLDQGLFTQYPDQEASELARAIAIKEHVPPSSVLVANGAAQIIYTIAQLWHKQRVAIVEPTFSEYEEACLANDCSVERIMLPPPWSLDLDRMTAVLKRTDLLFICHPNNPTGVAYRKEQLIELLELAKQFGTTLVIDEAFYDFMEVPITFTAQAAANEGIIVVRSMTKMFTIPGLRLGYAISAPSVIEKLKSKIPPWSVNGLADKAGQFCLRETMFVRDSAQRIAAARAEMQAGFRHLGFDVSPSVVNFFVISDPRESIGMLAMLKGLLDRGFVLRHTENFPGLDGRYLRVAVKDQDTNRKLLQAVKDWVEGGTSCLSSFQER
ncbi:threonine-phosphate decarboxylase CobD [Halalkalibacterium halodurans]|uniref:threonine-phosphate decarboxylase CobD n=1 Tax=Halalkalibacterium halodurans TaxID=86665 RepID=UPI002AA9FCF5|nr:threonine-phosphate decarboxylase CobD [Halalkalibacterium halodurans]MDY7222161.1 threonine-phosphate decarboxylase CobD [Halalkalibacterium halodurans]MDY7241382.1 threonine-phosphate decarboxylase CobD [Halalkalibacterium halodurans]